MAGRGVENNEWGEGWRPGVELLKWGGKELVFQILLGVRNFDRPIGPSI